MKQLDSTPSKLALSIPEVEKATGLGKDLIYSAINSGSLPSLKVGRRRLIRSDALKRWLADREAQTTKEMGFEVERDAAA